jgi:hypothetical protein
MVRCGDHALHPAVHLEIFGKMRERVIFSPIHHSVNICIVPTANKPKFRLPWGFKQPVTTLLIIVYEITHKWPSTRKYHG